MGHYSGGQFDRSVFPTAITLGNNRTLVGQAMYLGNPNISHLFVDMAYGDSCNEEALNITEFRGKVVLCKSESKTSIPLAKEIIANGGGLGLIFSQREIFNIEDIIGDFPMIAVDGIAFQEIVEYLLSAEDSSKVKMAPTQTLEGRTVFAPRVAAFSSRGPNKVFPGILKPDLTAPGLGILAAVGDSYEIFSGTSMSSPHVAGIVALIKSLHPTWSPAAIKSAIMTTASVVDNSGLPITADGNPRKLADPFDYGSGHINPNKAADPGLVYDINPKDFDEFNCSFGGFMICEAPRIPVYHLNLPSISIPDLNTKVTVSRTVANVGSAGSTYVAVVEPPPGVQMEVQPSKLVFDKHNERKTFTITLKSLVRTQGLFTFGRLTWKDATHTVRIPIAVRPLIQDFYADVA